MACSFVLGTPCQLVVLAGPEHGRTIPLADAPRGDRVRHISRSGDVPMEHGRSELLYFAGGSSNADIFLSLQQTSTDDLRLNFSCAFEDVQDTRVTKNATDLKLERIAVAAMNLQRAVCIRPGDASGDQLGHASLDVAAPVAILLAGGKIGDLARHHDFDRH